MSNTYNGMSKPTYENGITICNYKSWGTCNAQNPHARVQKAKWSDGCMWLHKNNKNHCTNPDIQNMVLKAHQKDKIS